MMKLGIRAALLFLLLAVTASANPYLPKPGEPPTKLRIATSAVTGGFVHLYSALDYGIFKKYGLRLRTRLHPRPIAGASCASERPSPVQLRRGGRQSPRTRRRRRSQVDRFPSRQAPLCLGGAQGDPPARRSQRQIHWRNPPRRLERSAVTASGAQIWLNDR